MVIFIQLLKTYKPIDFSYKTFLKCRVSVKDFFQIIRKFLFKIEKNIFTKQ